jgi:hypothetical protein
MDGGVRLTTARHFVLGIGGAVLLGAMCGVDIFAFLKAAGPLASDIRTALPPTAPLGLPDEGGMDLCHDCSGTINPVHAGGAIALAVFFVGGIPLAFVGVVLLSRANRTGATFRAVWGTVFHAALIFQLGSLLLGLLFLLSLVLATSGEFTGEVLSFAFALMLHVCWNGVGVMSWRKLHQRVEPRAATRLIFPA